MFCNLVNPNFCLSFQGAIRDARLTTPRKDFLFFWRIFPGNLHQRRPRQIGINGDNFRRSIFGLSLPQVVHPADHSAHHPHVQEQQSREIRHPSHDAGCLTHNESGRCAAPDSHLRRRVHRCRHKQLHPVEKRRITSAPKNRDRGGVRLPQIGLAQIARFLNF
ncbi:hypothetical protein TNCT_542811 [Trichonephila clavata]|uniref:Uncharacterized protein n=1 Tax=Trichonephila clavata TaxID=2740835 RepID=A0A8X6GFK1_TRICU|nr:hypothetical protein TNCT_542811 [Trichonephila clavata]